MGNDLCNKATYDFSFTSPIRSSNKKSRTLKIKGYSYPKILNVRQFDDSEAVASGLVARYNECTSYSVVTSLFKTLDLFCLIQSIDFIRISS